VAGRGSVCQPDIAPFARLSAQTARRRSRDWAMMLHRGEASLKVA
jgi:hypothetical protein